MSKLFESESQNTVGETDGAVPDGEAVGAVTEGECVGVMDGEVVGAGVVVPVGEIVGAHAWSFSQQVCRSMPSL